MNSKEELSKEKAEKSYLHHRDFEKHLDEKSGGGKNDRHPGMSGKDLGPCASGPSLLVSCFGHKC
jgi:hypothetical protein